MDTILDILIILTLAITALWLGCLVVERIGYPDPFDHDRTRDDR